jgi:hypothetical protein
MLKSRMLIAAVTAIGLILAALPSAVAEPNQAQVKSQAQSKAQAKGRATATRIRGRSSAAYQSCFDQCMNENDCGSYRSRDAAAKLMYTACIAGWTAGCAAGCSGLRR